MMVSLAVLAEHGPPYTSYVRVLYTTGGLSYIYSSRVTCLMNQATPYSLAAEIGSGSTVIMAKLACGPN